MSEDLEEHGIQLHPAIVTHLGRGEEQGEGAGNQLVTTILTSHLCRLGASYCARG